MADFTPLCAPGGRAFSRAAFLSPENPSEEEDPFQESEELEEPQPLETSETESWSEEEPQAVLEEEEPPAAFSGFSEEEVDRMRTEAFQLGVLEGRQEAEAELERLRVQSEQVESLAGELEGLRKRIHKEVTQDVSELVLYASRRVVGETLAVQPEALVRMVEGAIARLPGDDEVRIRIRPEAEEAVRSALGMRRAFVIEVDEDLEGGCVVEAAVGEVEASLEAAFEGLGQAVEDWLEEQR